MNKDRRPDETLDEWVIRIEGWQGRPCYLCGATAAVWPGSIFRDVKCDVCEEADEAEYARQGGQ